MKAARTLTAYPVLVLLVTGTTATAAGPDAPPVDFVKQVAPILQQRCLGCHGPQKQRAGLRLDSAERLRQGGDGGAVIRPGRGAASRLIQVVSGAAPDEVVMPPQGPRLTPDQVALLRSWIDQGAAWPPGLTLAAPRDSSAARSHWAWQPLRRPPPPVLRPSPGAANPVDAFIRTRLEAEGLEPAPPADRVTLIRRVSLDLVGLPPTPAEVGDFVRDQRPDAYERLVDRLLASPHYGEKWARPWLDLCHYGDTDGYLTDQLRPVAWRYRQWLLGALNRDLPFETFTTWQLAGDLLPGAPLEARLATGFLRNTLSNREGGADLEEFRVEQVVDRVATVSTTWLGLTVGCARCHDHKYDPVSQKEFFQFYAFLDGADEVNVDAPLPGEWEAFRARKPDHDRRRAELVRPIQAELEDLQRRWEARLLEAAAYPGRDHVWDRQWEVLGLVWGGNLGEGQLEGTQIARLPWDWRTPDQHERLQDYFLKHGSLVDAKRFGELKLAELGKQLDKLRAELPKVTRAPGMRETVHPRLVRVHNRGNFRAPGEAVTAGAPAFLPPLPADAPRNRLGLARWLTSPDNPVPARVLVNRAWQEFFGRGLVLTAEDFGTQGERPSHPELLDWLAAEFRERGGSMKSLHRLLVTSATYRQSSRVRPELVARDPHNRLVARQASLRLSAELTRDATLAVSGLLYPVVGGPSVFPPQPDVVAAEGFENRWTPSAGPNRHRRGLYTFLQRTSPFAQYVTFDLPANSRACTRRERSNTPLQALTLLNDPVFVEAAQALATRILREPGDADRRAGHAFRLALARPPSPGERARLAAYFREQYDLLKNQPARCAKLCPPGEVVTPERAAWTCAASVLLNLHEFITRD